MNWMTNMFGPKPTTVAALPNPAIPDQNSNQNQNTNTDITQKTDKTDGNGVVPKQETPKTPLDEHKDLWQTKKEETPTEDKDKLTPQQIAEAASKVDFSRILDADQLAKVKAGGEEAVGALVSLLNKTAQATYGQSMVAAQKMVEIAVAKKTSDFNSKVPDMLRLQSANQELLRSNPNLNNPVLGPIVEAIQNQVANKHPEATADQLKDMALQILKGSADLINPPNKDSNNTQSPKNSRGGKKDQEEDWLAWIKPEIDLS